MLTSTAILAVWILIALALMLIAAACIYIIIMLAKLCNVLSDMNLRFRAPAKAPATSVVDDETDSDEEIKRQRELDAAMRDMLNYSVSQGDRL